jgi:hypothetical protein
MSNNKYRWPKNHKLIQGSAKHEFVLCYYTIQPNGHQKGENRRTVRMRQADTHGDSDHYHNPRHGGSTGIGVVVAVGLK